MKYQSTRGGESGLSFQDVLFSGYAKDGGLYMPEAVPVVSPQELRDWSTLSYRSLLCRVARKFIDQHEIPDQDLHDIIESSFRSFKSGEEVGLVDITRRSRSGDMKEDEQPIYILELFRGPTFAFKDLALSLVAGLLEYFLTKQKRHVTIVVGTSGDTGGAAITAIEGRPNMELLVLLPRHRCSQPQLLQMTTSREKNITVFSVDGTSDDLDEPIKRCFSSSAFVSRHNLMSINSINWGRILGQVAHFFYGYFRRLEGADVVTGSTAAATVEVVAPTGAAGNLVSGCLAHAMGLPITIIPAVNTNDVVARAMNGEFSTAAVVHTSLSSAMDIQVPYNVERLLYLCSGLDVTLVRTLMNTFETKGAVLFPEHVMTNLRKVITGSCVYGDSKVLQVMRAVYQQYGYMLCPHTATGVAHHSISPPAAETPRLYVATASSVKFPEAVRRCLCEVEPVMDPAAAASIVQSVTRPLDHLKLLPTTELRMEKGEDWEDMLKQKIEELNAGWLTQ